MKFEVSTELKIHINPDVATIMETHPAVEQHLLKTAQKIVTNARQVFIRAKRHPEMVTPPPYAESFFVRRHHVGRKLMYLAGNDDPAVALIEFGGHAGGKTKVLGYRPLGRGADAILGGM